MSEKVRKVNFPKKEKVVPKFQKTRKTSQVKKGKPIKQKPTPETRKRGRNPITIRQLATHHFKEGSVLLTRAILRRVIKILCAKESDYKVLIQIQNALGIQSFLEIRNAAMYNQTKGYVPKKKKPEPEVKPDPVLQLLFQKVCYSYRKECMEDFFVDPRLCYIFKLLAPVIIKEGHNICQNRKNNTAEKYGKEVVQPVIYSEEKIKEIQADFKKQVKRL